MRRIIAVLGIAILGTLGCKHVGGKCDCGPGPGEAVTYAPMSTYQTTPVVKETIAAPKDAPKK